jgi:diguanylate cyclase (GGDEF)-like protein
MSMSEHATQWILIVDDDTASIKIMARALAPDFVTESALSGPEALARLATGDLPTLILLDVMMPDMDGFDVCRQLKAEAHTRDIPVIFITANHHLESEMNALLVGASDFIHKPINPQVMRQRVQLHILLREREQALSQLNEEIKLLSYYDTLTGLPNRRLLIDRLHNRLLLIDRLQQNLSNSDRCQEVGALMYIDLDNFKTFNDTLGQDIGDQLLQQVARRLTACARKTDTVARFYDDEFVVVLENLTEPLEAATAQAETIAQRFLATLRQPYRVADADHQCTASIGIILLSNPYTSVEDLLIKASLATEQAKMAGRNTLCFVDPEI